MTDTLNRHSFAPELIKKGKVVLDQRDDWSEHQPSTRQENEFIETHGWDEPAMGRGGKARCPLRGELVSRA